MLPMRKRTLVLSLVLMVLLIYAISHQTFLIVVPAASRGAGAASPALVKNVANMRREVAAADQRAVVGAVASEEVIADAHVAQAAEAEAAEAAAAAEQQRQEEEEAAAAAAATAPSSAAGVVVVPNAAAQAAILNFLPDSSALGVKVQGGQNANAQQSAGSSPSRVAIAPTPIGAAGPAQPIQVASRTPVEIFGPAPVPTSTEETEAAAAVGRARAWLEQRIREVQFPSSCAAPQRFINCSLGAGKSCGFGCQFHHLVYCVIAGIATNRTVVLDMHGWRYAETAQCHNPDPWTCFFQPASACTMADIAARPKQANRGALKDMTVDVIDLGFRASREYNQWAPPFIAEQLKAFHPRPQLWFVGHVNAFLLRMRPDVAEAYAAAKAASGFEHPILGVHARGDDKIQETDVHLLSEYLQLAPKLPRVYLATDDQRNLEEMARFPETSFRMLRTEGGRVSGVGRRFGNGAFMSLLFDILMLSECDHFIGSDGSQISRMVYELQQVRHVRGFDKGWSIHTILKDKVNGFFWYLI